MSTSKHTAGPWRVKTNGNVWVGVESCDFHHPEYGAAAHDVGIERHAIATTHGTQASANARLIAAAPELLEALQVCEARLCQVGVGSINDAILASARAAIAKARGQQVQA